MLTVVGHELGLLLQVLLAAAGIGSLAERSVVAYEVLRIAGARAGVGQRLRRAGGTARPG